MITFEKYFKQWSNKYYKNAKIGKDGDFYTSVSTSKFFGGAIANYILENIENNTLTLPLNIIDIGANNLDLIRDIHDFLNAISIGVVEKCHFFAVESNVKSEPKAINVLDDITNLKPLKYNSFFIANEFFDALPCHLYYDGCIGYVEKGNKLYFKKSNQYIKKIAESNEIYQSELPISYFEFCKTIEEINPSNIKWIFAVFDYGNAETTNQFSLRAFYKHRTIPLINNNEFINGIDRLYKISDITYNVPFAILNDAFKNIGATRILYKPQYIALIDDFKILSLIEQYHKHATQIEYLRETNKIKNLLNISSSNFKVTIYNNFS